MLPRERVIVSLDFRPPDVVPLECHPSPAGLYEHGARLQQLLRDHPHDFGDFTDLAALGVRLMNIMPLIPCGRMRDRRAPTCDELQAARRECEQAVPQFRSCVQCSADVVHFPRAVSAANGQTRNG